MKSQLTSFIDFLTTRQLVNPELVTDDVIQQFIDQYRSSELSMDDIVLAVASHFNMTVGDIKNRTRRNTIKEPRHIAMWMLRKYIRKCSLAVIGEQLGGYSHSNVLQSIRKVNNLRYFDKQFNETFNQVHEAVLQIVDKTQLKKVA